MNQPLFGRTPRMLIAGLLLASLLVSVPSLALAGKGVADTVPPSAPTNLVATAGVVSGTYGTIDLTWAPSSDNVRVTRYRIEYIASSYEGWTEIGSTTGTSFSATGLSQATGYYFRVRATDAAGNLSEYSNTAYAVAPGLRYAGYDDSDSSVINRTGFWELETGTGYWGGNAQRKSNIAGATTTFTFVGTSVVWYGTRHINNGIARVYLDGVQQPDVDCYGPKQVYFAEMFSKAGLENTTHVLTIEVTGTKRARAIDSYVTVDGFIITF